MCEVIPEPTTLADILIVDDTPANLDVLAEMLEEQGYGTRPVPSGVLALQSARAQPPDLILLDINMPEMDGYEVCKHVKADDNLKDIPVIFISALRDTTDKVHAFDAGAVDYITKPFQFDEVKARVQTHLRTYRMQRELEQQYAAIKKLEELKDNLTHMIVHDMASPIQTIGLAVDVVLSGEAGRCRENVDVLSRASDASRNLSEMIDSLLDISRMEAGRLPLHPTDVNLRHLAEGVAETMHLLADAKNIRLIVEGPDVPLHADADLIRRVFINLIRNALKFTPKDSEVTITVSASDGLARAEVRDTGIGIPEECHERIFEKFGQVDAGPQGHERSFGLGLAFCRLAVVAHGGTIGVRSRLGAGSSFWFVLPITNTNDPNSEPEEQTSSEHVARVILPEPQMARRRDHPVALT
jgi:two-component system sensor histidine kinase/response regulator